jgi:murein DD-endopeptidase MepM/ murein hydrolase activator NlpD
MQHRPFGPPRLVLALPGVALIAASVVLSAQNVNPEALNLSVVDPPRPLKPGSVALITVRATHDLVELTGEVAGRAVYFWPAASAKEWSGLAGINLETRPGAVTLTIEGRGTAGSIGATSVSLLVEPYRFETRRLRVDSKLANPPEEELERIKQEAKAMADAFAVLTPDRVWHGRFEAPVPGAATSSFGRLTITNGKPSGRHQGADFRAATGTPVRAPNAGRVVLAQSLYFAGNTVILDHGLGVFSLLAHLSRIDIVPGAVVARGEILGESGATGRVTGPHLHWAVRFGEMTVDPLALIAALSKQTDDGPASR